MLCYIMLCYVTIGDRDLEAKVDECLLIRFYGCGCSDENEKEDHLDDKTKASLQETEVGSTRIIVITLLTIIIIGSFFVIITFIIVVVVIIMIVVIVISFCFNPTAVCGCQSIITL